MAKDKKKDKEIKILEDKIQEITSEKDKYLDIAIGKSKNRYNKTSLKYEFSFY